jgi:hypothetical protein
MHAEMKSVLPPVCGEKDNAEIDRVRAAQEKVERSATRIGLVREVEPIIRVQQEMVCEVLESSSVLYRVVGYQLLVEPRREVKRVLEGVGDAIEGESDISGSD